MIDKLGRANRSEGYVNIIDLFSDLQILGFKEFEIIEAIKKQLKSNLISTAEVGYEDIPRKVRILPAGAYTLLKLACKFTYIDSMIVDTPITFSDYRDKVHDVITIEERLDRAILFLEYLKKAWSDTNSNYFNWPEYEVQIRREIYNIQYSARRNAQKIGRAHV